MTLRVIGKNIDVGEALRERAEERVTAMLEKYFSHGYSGKVALEKTGQSFKADFSIHLDSGIDLQAEGEGEDAYRSLDTAAERLEKRLRRYKRRLKDHHNGRTAAEPVIAPSFVLADVDDEDEATSGTDEAPLVVAESSTKIRIQTVGMAAMALDLSTEPVVVFQNAANGRLNIVYRRTDGNIGWIDPPAADKA